MSQPLNPADAARWLWELGEQMDAETRELAQLRHDYVEAQRKHRLAYAEAFLSAEGTVEDRKRIAERQVIDEHTELEAQEQMIEVSREKLRTLRERSEVGRQLSATLKWELSAMTSGYEYG